MTTLHAARATSDAVVFNLRAAGLIVGDGDAPTAAGWQGTPGQSTFVAYTVVYPIAGGTSDGTVAAPDADAEALYQLSSVGVSRQQAEAQADRARTVMLTWPLTVTGRAVPLVRLDSIGGAFRDDEGAPMLFTVADRYRIHTTPA